MGLQEVKADVKLARERLLKLDPAKLNLQSELTENILPIFDGIVDALNERFQTVEDDVADLGEAVDEMIDQQGDMLHPETSTRIVGVLELGKLVAAELEQLLAKSGDELTKKRCRTLVKSYRQGAEVALQMIAEITVPIEPEEPEETKPGDKPAEPEEPEDEEGEEDDDEDEIAAEGGAP